MKKILLLLAILVTLLFFYSIYSQNNNTIEDKRGTLNSSITEEVKPSGTHNKEKIKLDEKKYVEISFWSFPVGEFGNKEVIQRFVTDFNKLYPYIKVNVHTLDYSTGDFQIEKAIEARKAPDIVMEGPERLLANWGARGLMIDLRNMIDNETKANIAATSEEVINACQAPDGAFYEYPMVMTTHLMAINYELFEKANALQFIDEENRSWTADGFIAAMAAIRDSGLVETPGIIYTGGQGGDQGTRALVSNLYDAPFTTDDHSGYLINQAFGIMGLELLQEMVNNASLSHNDTMVATDELKAFAKEKTAITLAWNATNEILYADLIDFTPFAMNFPSVDGKAELQGGIWGFGIFNNGNMNKVEAAKKFIEFLATDPQQREKSIRATNFFPVNKSHGNVYAGSKNEEKMQIYTSFLTNLGDYYQVTPAWPQQRVAWYKMLQDIFNGADAKSAADSYVDYLHKQINP